ncbi:hypothetical protein AVEN_257545-1 [Araneus ventricosus]|uniref:Uncharacterized protein n=1 Tax=Araneus ventricosus TaxID=182803 RepID=A0A4Y2L231_ARAVE|nr:hypothetical protein AVEN_257545-1 [Araneus ventricosus]
MIQNGQLLVEIHPFSPQSIKEQLKLLGGTPDKFIKSFKIQSTILSITPAPSGKSSAILWATSRSRVPVDGAAIANDVENQAAENSWRDDEAVEDA